MQTARRARHLAALAATTLALSACGGGDDGASDETSSDTSTTQSETKDSPEDASDEESEDRVTASEAGVSFDLPDGWTSIDPNDVQDGSDEVPGAVEDLAESQGMDAATFLENIAQSVDIMLIGETQGDFTDNVNIIPSPGTMDKATAKTSLAEGGATVESVEDMETDLGPGIDATYTMSTGGTEIHGRSLSFPTDDGVAIFTVSASSADTADEVATTIRDSIDKA